MENQGAKNILFITADEMRADATGFMGNPDCRTPNLDRLAARGTVFENHFTVHGKCVPSRIAMLTGRYAHTDAIRTVNATNHIPRGTPNAPEALRARGYETSVFGLNHVWDNDYFYGKTQDGGAAVDYQSFSKPEFDSLAKRDLPVPAGQTAPAAIREELAMIDYSGCVEGKLTGFHDVNRADQAVHYLKHVRDRSKPFYLQVNLSKPHPPYAIPEPYYSMVNRDALTPWPYDLPENATLHLRKQRELRLGNNISEAALRELQAVYYGMCAFVDNCIGNVLDALDAEGLWEDTLVVFCSDHGDFAGQYGINEKWDTAMQECILHVPMIVAGAGLPEGKRFSGLTEHVDIAETFLDITGTATGPEWVRHGESLLPCVRGESSGKEAVFADGGHEASMRARFNRPVWQEKQDGRKTKATGGKQLVYSECPDTMARVNMVRTDTWKLAIRETGGNELFNIKDDPHEMNNLFGKPGHEAVIIDLQRRLIEWNLKTAQDRPFQEVVGA